MLHKSSPHSPLLSFITKSQILTVFLSHYFIDKVTLSNQCRTNHLLSCKIPLWKLFLYTTSHTFYPCACHNGEAPFNLLASEQAPNLLEEHRKFDAKRMSPSSPYVENGKRVRRLTTSPLRVFAFCQFVKVLNNNCLRQHRHAFKSCPQAGSMNFRVLTVTSATL